MDTDRIQQLEDRVKMLEDKLASPEYIRFLTDKISRAQQEL